MSDYFTQLKQYNEKFYIITTFSEKKVSITVNSLLGFSINDEVRVIYENYDSFVLKWINKQGKYIGSINFIGYNRLIKEHDDFILMMKECYDVETDELNISNDIVNWYPLIWFANGDAFCMDVRDGAIYFFEHEVFEGEKNIYGLKIASSANELFYKWNKIHFIDFYYWDEIVNEGGIDLSTNPLQRLL